MKIDTKRRMPAGKSALLEACSVQHEQAGRVAENRPSKAVLEGEPDPGCCAFTSELVELPLGQ